MVPVLWDVLPVTKDESQVDTSLKLRWQGAQAGVMTKRSVTFSFPLQILAAEEIGVCKATLCRNGSHGFPNTRIYVEGDDLT